MSYTHTHTLKYFQTSNKKLLLTFQNPLKKQKKFIFTMQHLLSLSSQKNNTDDNKGKKHISDFINDFIQNCGDDDSDNNNNNKNNKKDDDCDDIESDIDYPSEEESNYWNEEDDDDDECRDEDSSQNTNCNNHNHNHNNNMTILDFLKKNGHHDINVEEYRNYQIELSPQYNDNNNNNNININDYKNNTKKANNSRLCCVCFKSYKLCKYGLDALDHYPSIDLQLDQTFSNPCNTHYICGYCVRDSLNKCADVVLKIGAGDFPCLGNLGCKNHLNHKTSTVLNQVRYFFNDIEWRQIRTAQQRQINNRDMTIKYHPFLTPLTPLSDVTFDKIINRLSEILSQDSPRIKCPVCCVMIQKTTDCYSVRHCDWETCWMCHKVERRLSPEHWKTCPRYDTHPGWQKNGFLCGDNNHCKKNNENDEEECKNLTHQPGITMMNNVRKSYQLYFLLNSSPDDIIKSNKLPDLKQHLNLYMSVCNDFK